MTWTVPITLVDGDPLTAAQLNMMVRDNMLASEVGIASVKSRLITTTNRNEIVERQWARAYSFESFGTEAQFPYTEDEEGTLLGPTCTVEHGGAMLLLYDARMDMTTGGGNCMYAPVVDGQLPEGSNYAARTASEGFIRFGGHYWWTGEPGVSTITMAYGVSNSTSKAGYAQRRLTAIPF